MQLKFHHGIDQESGSVVVDDGVIGLLDDYLADGMVGLATTKLNKNYSGPCMDVYNGTSTTSIGFLADGSIDTAAIAAHCGANNGRVVTWYDQFENFAVDFTQSTDADRPLIYDGSSQSVIVGLNDKPAIQFSSGDHLEDNAATPNMPNATNFYFIAVVEAENTGVEQRVISRRSPSPASFRESNYLFGFNNTKPYCLTINTNNNIKSITGTTEKRSDKGYCLEYAVYNQNSELFFDGQAEGNLSLGGFDPNTTGTQQTIIGIDAFDGNSPFVGKMQLLVGYNANKIAIRQNIFDAVTGYYPLVEGVDDGIGGGTGNPGGAGGATLIFDGELPNNNSYWQTNYGTSVPTANVSWGTDGTYGDYMQINFPSTGGQGVNKQCRMIENNVIPSGETDLYFDWYLFLKSGFDFRNAGSVQPGGKMPGFFCYPPSTRSTGRKSPSGCRLGGYTNYLNGTSIPNGRDSWSARLMWKGDGRIVGYLYVKFQDYYLGHPGNVQKTLSQASPSEFNPCGNNVQASKKLSTFGTGAWLRITQRVKLNDIGQKNGILQLWIDEELIIDKRDIIYRDIVGDLWVGDLFFGGWFGGGSNDGPKTAGQWLRIAQPRIYRGRPF